LRENYRWLASGWFGVRENIVGWLEKQPTELRGSIIYFVKENG